MGSKLNWAYLLTTEKLSDSATDRSYYSVEEALECDYRNIISAASFRRLQDKTQVFPLEQSDFVRTRLTHSLEVSSLAKSLAAKLVNNLRFLDKAADLCVLEERAIGDVLLCAGLIHDIGNPPFGHYGETTIRDWFRLNMPKLQFKGKSLEELLPEEMKQDFYFYEGNAQGLRLLTQLHYLGDMRGMNLSCAVLNTIIKYPQSSLEAAAAVTAGKSNGRNGKIGYFHAEADIFAGIVAASGCRGVNHPLSLILEAADDISYRTADIEDAYRKGRFSFQELRSALRNNGRLRTCTELQRGELMGLITELDEYLDRSLLRKGSKPEQFALENWLAALREYFANEAAKVFAEKYELIMDGAYAGELAKAGAAGVLLDILGDIAYDYVFSSKQIVQMEIGAHTIIGGLLSLFVPACINWDTEGSLTSVEPRLMSIISDNYRASYHQQKQGRDEVYALYLRLLLVCDYIAGMTDSFAKRMYKKLMALD